MQDYENLSFPEELWAEYVLQICAVISKGSHISDSKEEQAFQKHRAWA